MAMMSELALSTRGSLTPGSLVRDLRHLPCAPRVLPRLQRMLRHGHASLADVVAVIRLDPAIAGRVLQMGNSAYYNNGARCFSVDEAIHRVGHDQVFELVSCAVASRMMARPLETYGLEADCVWRMSVACALAAEMLAGRIGLDRETGYTAGLLHAVGMVAIDEWTQRYQPELRLGSKGLPQEASESERLCLGFTQADAGAALLADWEFPREICDPVRYQYTPRACVAHPKMAGVLHVAKWMRSAVCDPADDLPPLPGAAIQQMLALPAGTLPALAGELEQRFQQMSSILDVEPATDAPASPSWW